MARHTHKLILTCMIFNWPRRLGCYLCFSVNSWLELATSPLILLWLHAVLVLSSFLRCIGANLPTRCWCSVCKLRLARRSGCWPSRMYKYIIMGFAHRAAALELHWSRIMSISSSMFSFLHLSCLRDCLIHSDLTYEKIEYLLDVHLCHAR
jgi:hypothetical protein